MLRHIHILRSPRVPMCAMSAARAGIVKTLDAAGARNKFVIRNMGKRRDIPYRDWKNNLLPGRSVDWYVSEGLRQNLSEVHGFINGDYLLGLLETGPWQKKQAHLFFFLTRDYIHSLDKTDSVVGLGKFAAGALLSVASYPRFDDLALANIMIDSAHEWGHVCGLLPADRPLERRSGLHCNSDPCAMQKSNRAEDVMSAAFREKPFCAECVRDLRRRSLQ